jgi:hypothetical protein
MRDVVQPHVATLARPVRRWCLRTGVCQAHQAALDVEALGDPLENLVGRDLLLALPNLANAGLRQAVAAAIADRLQPRLPRKLNGPPMSRARRIS